MQKIRTIDQTVPFKYRYDEYEIRYIEMIDSKTYADRIFLASLSKRCRGWQSFRLAFSNILYAVRLHEDVLNSQS